MSPAAIVRELRQRDPALAAAGGCMIAGFLVAALLASVDTRLVLGINPWIKPMKFLSSIAIFLWTMAWFMPEADPTHARRRRLIRSTMIATMAGEILLISMQAARGTTSHFNVTTVFDGVVFDTMGAMILVNTLAVAAFLTTLRRETPAARAGYLWGLRGGLWLFVIGSLQGFVMVANMGHAVPGPDGGPGVPFLNWSTTSGDLRVAHFMGLHSLQALPFAGFLLDSRSGAVPAIRRGIVSTAALLWGIAMLTALWMALKEQPLFAF